MGARCPVDLPDRGSFILGSNSVFGDVAVGSDPDIELGAIRTRQQGLGPMMINGSARKVRQLGAGSGDAGLPFLIGIAHDGIGVRNVEIIADQCDAERRIEVVQEDGSLIGNAIAIGVAQQRDAVSALGCGAGEPRYPVSDYVLGPVDWRFRTIALDH